MYTSVYWNLTEFKSSLLRFIDYNLKNSIEGAVQQFISKSFILENINVCVNAVSQISLKSFNTYEERDFFSKPCH